MSKKQQVLIKLFERCQQRGIDVFDNDEVEEVCREVGFKNKFDVTKLDHKGLLPDELLSQDYGILHLGGGKHQFVRGLHHLYHDLETIEQTIDWQYHASLLNAFNNSEANSLSVANNQRILHHFLFGLDREFETLDIQYRPKTYFPHRTKANLTYACGKTPVALRGIQLEVDLTIEYQGIVGVFEAKNGSLGSFALYQLFHPFLYYHHARQLGIKEVVAVYVIYELDGQMPQFDLRAYTFTDPTAIDSIQLKRACRYRLLS